MKKQVLFILLTFIFFSAGAQESKSYQFSLEDCLRFAFANSYERQSMELSTESQKVTYEQSKLQAVPNLNASLGENMSIQSSGWSAQGNVSLGSSTTFYQGGNIRRNIEQNRLNMERSEAQVERYDNQLTTQILQSFLTILGNQEMLNYQLEVMKTSREQLKQGAARYNAGSILESDYLMLEAQYFSDSNNVVDSRINIENNILELKILLSMDPTDALEIIIPNTENLDELYTSLPTETEVIDQAMDYLPDLKMSDFDIQIAKNSVGMAKGNYLPSIGASANVGMGLLPVSANGLSKWGNTPSGSVGVSLSVPIYSRGQLRSNLKKSEISLQQAELDYQQSKLTVRQTVAQAYRDVVSAFNAYKVSGVKEEAYRKNFAAYNLQYQVGTITTVELLQQQNNYLNALNSYIQNKYSLLMKRKVLDVYTGKAVTL